MFLIKLQSKNAWSFVSNKVWQRWEKKKHTQPVTSHTDSIILKLWKTRNKETAIAPSQ